MNNISTLKRRSYIALEITLQNAFTIYYGTVHTTDRGSKLSVPFQKKMSTINRNPKNKQLDMHV